MKIKSLGTQTDLFFNRFCGEVESFDNYTIIKTPTNPGFHWGNYIIFNRSPRKGDLVKWRSLFDKHFEYYKEPHHYTFLWDTESDDKGEDHEFIEAGFESDSSVVLATSSLIKPKFYNTDLEVRIINTEKQWADVLDLQVKCADTKFVNDYYLDFKRQQFIDYQNMTKAGLGFWFGAYLNDKLVGDLGIFSQGELARYQSVGTHPDFRRQGICGTLVFKASKIMLADNPIQKFVMQADPNYHAARIYESVGFQRVEVNHALSWWKR